MKYSEFQPGLKARAATAVVALSTAFTVISLGLAAVTAEPARAQGLASTVRAALTARLPKTPITGLSSKLRPINVAQVGMPQMKARVPSTGSSTQVNPDRLGFSPYSSPLIP